ncbi:hypothetical protein GT034_17675 [Streptomyces sp. SID2563]|uniref:hypothetical protein n=1 Tax=Streptomyces sp. SID2563 TaxID=2690255 RepID=UPI00136B6F7A|nr:hypothetical protein [Streptomyces sp. SID2563]MYW10166.1 hypothetical protein [Streptomyces sp. SID2563]
MVKVTRLSAYEEEREPPAASLPFPGVRVVVWVVTVLDVEGACLGDLGIHLTPAALDRYQPSVAQRVGGAELAGVPGFLGLLAVRESAEQSELTFAQGRQGCMATAHPGAGPPRNDWNGWSLLAAPETCGFVVVGRPLA